MTISEVQKLTANVEGFLSQNGTTLREGEVLYYLARRSAQRGKIVEIGSWKGKSTIWLGVGSASGPKSQIYAIDHHTGSSEHRQTGKVWTFPEFQQNISKAKLDSLVHPILKNSLEGAQDIESMVDLIFIDGSHEYEYVRQDFETWFPKLMNGGTLAFHDSFWPGVRKVVHQKVFKSPYFKKARYVNSIVYAIKTEKATYLERIENRFSLLIKQIHWISLYLPQPFKSLIKKGIWRPFQRKWLNRLSIAE
ncbi:MAG: class I SAM-dependent methyltransferase [Chlamydiales bacterium]